MEDKNWGRMSLRIPMYIVLVSRLKNVENLKFTFFHVSPMTGTHLAGSSRILAGSGLFLTIQLLIY